MNWLNLSLAVIGLLFFWSFARACVAEIPEGDARQHGECAGIGMFFAALMLIALAYNLLPLFGYSLKLTLK